ncbi:MAG: hypothetical protein ACOCUW_03780 [Gemmatimonadota bacterium]
MIKRAFLAFLFVFLLVLTIPPLRQRAQPSLDRLGAWLGENLEGPMSPILNPYRKLKTEGVMQKAIQEMTRDRNMGIARPAPDEFTEFIQREIEGETGLDAWGSPLILGADPDSAVIISAGPDLEYDTDDDVVLKMRYAVPRRTFPRRR